MDSVAPPRLTETVPSFLKADIAYSLERYRPQIADEWDQLRPHDCLYLVTIQMMPEYSRQHMEKNDDSLTGQEFKQKYGIKHIRGCEILQILGDEGNPVYDFNAGKNPDKDGVTRISGRSRNVRVLMDPNEYQQDIAAYKNIYDLYGTFNLLVRRHASQNNAKAVLETIRDLMQSDLVVPDWIHDILLGYGNRNSAHYSQLESPTRTIDFGFTFLNWDHLVKSFPNLVFFSF